MTKGIKTFDNLSGLPTGLLSLEQLKRELGDAMVDNVAVVGDNLVITFNTTSGKEPIVIPLSSLAQPLMVETTYAALKALRDNSQLTKGTWYRITDYVTTTTQEDTQSAGHQFDIIVRADSVNVLNENAYAAILSGDTYFSTAGAKLETWELKYCLDNDTERFGWADTTNGKGVIYYMKDEFGNEAPYDFKNIKFKRYKITAHSEMPLYVNKYFGMKFVDYGWDKSNYLNPEEATISTSDTAFKYTFDYNGADYSLVPRLNRCEHNIIKPFIINEGQANKTRRWLNNVTFLVNGGECYGNILENDCYLAVFGDGCKDNHLKQVCWQNFFGNECRGIVLQRGCSYNEFEQSNQNITLEESCNGNMFRRNSSGGFLGRGCGQNIFGRSCNIGTFGVNCNENTLGEECAYNTFGDGCFGNTLADCCEYNTFGQNCGGIEFAKGYSCNIIVESGNRNITLTSTESTGEIYLLRNITIAQGINNTSESLTISHDTVNDTFRTVYKPAESQEITIEPPVEEQEHPSPGGLIEEEP